MILILVILIIIYYCYLLDLHFIPIFILSHLVINRASWATGQLNRHSHQLNPAL